MLLRQTVDERVGYL